MKNNVGENSTQYFSPSIQLLIVSIIIDVIGCISYVIPFFGELVDSVWAPLSAAIIYQMYGSVPVSVFGFFEEALPGSDIVPTATLAWLYFKYQARNANKNKKEK